MALSAHLSRAQAHAIGLEQSSVENLFERRALQRLKGSRELFTLNHVALSAGVSLISLQNIISRSGTPYTLVEIPKATGGTRTLYSPSEELKKFQRWLLDNVLPSHGPRHPASFAYERGVTMLECVSQHVGATWMIKTDLHNFFPSVPERSVYNSFRRLEYSPLLSFELSRLCTWPVNASTKRQSRTFATEDFPFLPYPTGVAGSLPQGAPTSGALANEALRPVDQALSLLAARNGFIYTRYSDDLAFSSNASFSREKASIFLTEVRKIVTSRGYSLHAKKTKVIPPGSRKLLLGMLIGAERVAILPEHRRRLRLYVHCVNKYGVTRFAAARGFDSGISFINHVYGWLSYLQHIEPEWVHSQKILWEIALRKHDINPESLK